ncbi:MAG: FecCD family ABC transporter permease [Sporichthyaceae bacterium]
MSATTRAWSVVLFGLAVVLAGMTYTVSRGPVTIPLLDAWSVIGRHVLGLPIGESVDPVHDAIVWTLRVPPTALAALVGAGLALAGVGAQALVRNPLADAGILGVSAGAALAAVAVLSFGIAGATLAAVSSAAFVGAMAALLLVIALGTRRGVVSPLRLVLAGVALAQLLGGLTSLLVLRAQDAEQVFSILYWLGGSLQGARIHTLWMPALAVLVGGAVLFADAGRLNALLIGEETAASLGVNVNFLRWRLVAAVGLLAGVMVSQSGMIGFVGLVIPHIARLLVGSDHRLVLPVAAVGGAAFLVVCDIISRELLAPQLIPIGIVAGLFGAPLFIWLLRRSEAFRV